MGLKLKHVDFELNTRTIVMPTHISAAADIER